MLYVSGTAATSRAAWTARSLLASSRGKEPAKPVILLTQALRTTSMRSRWRSSRCSSSVRSRSMCSLLPWQPSSPAEPAFAASAARRSASCSPPIQLARPSPRSSHQLCSPRPGSTRWSALARRCLAPLSSSLPPESSTSTQPMPPRSSRESLALASSRDLCAHPPPLVLHEPPALLSLSPSHAPSPRSLLALRR